MKSLLQQRFGSLEGLLHLLLLFEDIVTERFEDILKFLEDPSVVLAGGGMIDVLDNLSHHLCSNHGIRLSRKRWSCQSQGYCQIQLLGEVGSSQGCGNRRINQDRRLLVELSCLIMLLASANS